MSQRNTKPLLVSLVAGVSLCAVVGSWMGIRWLFGHDESVPVQVRNESFEPVPHQVAVHPLPTAQISAPIVSLPQGAKPIVGARISASAMPLGSVKVNTNSGLAPDPAASDAMAVAMRPSLKYKRNYSGKLAIVTLGNPGATAKQDKPATVFNSDREKLIESALKMEDDRKFAMSMCRDLQGCLWVGTEGGGVQRFDPSAPELKQWTEFTTKDGLGDDNGYAVACDRLGRIWVGHLNHGVSVFNGQKWQNYEVVGGISSPTSLNGPLGERIFNIKVCPTDGDVWMATNCGLARYSEKLNTWSYYTRADGMPSDQVQAIAFDQNGDIYEGTQCDGIAIARASDGYKNWQVITGPEKLPTEPTGTGLPTNLINDLLVVQDGTVYAATTTGLAWSSDKGVNWQFVRGLDWADKVRGLIGGQPAEWVPKPGAWLSEDYITTMAEGTGSTIWVGHRESGFEHIDTAHGKSLETIAAASPASCIIPCTDGLLLAAYQDGISMVGSPNIASGNATNPASLPSSANPPPPAALDAEMQSHWRAREIRPIPCYLGDDWTTQGDWVERYGHEWAVLSAMGSSLDHKYNWNSENNIKTSIGFGARNGDRLRGWVQWVETDNPKSLYDPIIGVRRQAEWDDHGEAYPLVHEGPGIKMNLTLAAGLHRVSFYFFNKDGHNGRNCLRDYVLNITMIGADVQSVEVARARVRDFWGGEYKQFALQGPGKFQITIDRNYSMNTICSGVMIDKIEGPVTEADQTPIPWIGHIRYTSSSVLQDGSTPSKEPAKSLTDDANILWGDVTVNLDSPRKIFCQRQAEVIAYRSSSALKASTNLLNEWRWQLHLWTPLDRQVFTDTMLKAWELQLKETPILAKYHHAQPKPAAGG